MSVPGYVHPIVAELAKRMREEPRHLILVTGPRQTGKTTAVLQALKEVDLQSQYVDVDATFQPAFLALPESVSVQEPPVSSRWCQRRGSGRVIVGAGIAHGIAAIPRPRGRAQLARFPDHDVRRSDSGIAS